jgi:DNA ligase 1
MKEPKRFLPLLAGKADLLQVRYPVAATVKVDGLRAVILDGVAVSRSLKPIRNKNIREVLSGLPMLDGELIQRGGNFQQSTHTVMSADGGDDWVYLVFDYISDLDNIPGYAERMRQLKELSETTELPPQIQFLFPTFVYEKSDLLEIHRQHLADGFEGTMIRSPDGPYKFGRSTIKEGTLLKLKQFDDFEARIIGFDEMMHNKNEATTNALGLTERSSHKENKVASGVLGSFIVQHCKHPIMTFRVGTGLTAAQREQFWNDRDVLVGKIIKVRAMTFGVKDLPRHPSFIGFRDPDDLD